MAVTKISSSTGGTGGANATYTWSHTISAGSNRCLVVFTTHQTGSYTTGITFNGDALTNINTANNEFNHISAWYLINPDEGTHDIVVTAVKIDGYKSALAIDFTGVNQSDAIGANNTAASTGATITPENASSYLLSAICAQSTYDITASTNCTLISYFNRSATNNQRCSGGYNNSHTTSAITLYWTVNGGYSYPATTSIELLPAAAAGPANLKTYNTNAKANIKTINTNLIANCKSLNTNI